MTNYDFEYFINIDFNRKVVFVKLNYGINGTLKFHGYNIQIMYGILKDVVFFYINPRNFV